MKNSAALLLFLLFISCDKNRISNTDAVFTSNLDKYLADNFKTARKQNQLYYIIPMHGCSNCINNHFDILKNRIRDTSNITIILSGNITRKKWLEDVEILNTRNYNILFDKKDNASIYNIGLLKPVVAEKRDGSWIYYNKVEDSEIKELVDYINSRRTPSY